ncbi:D-isomer specific 2-hydroxyacid dehydrogenase, NAD-binding domain conserved site [Phytophthora cactorum]|nr:D-isomer specific 2-hydroxyacid dehydrogenase, NAD-binding domain conserved site [Phytophthora cactorum]
MANIKATNPNNHHIQTTMMQGCMASFSRRQGLSMARRWLPGFAHNFTTAQQRKDMRIGFFSAHNYEIDAMKALAERAGIAKDSELVFFSNRLTQQTTQLAENCEGICIFVNDVADATALRRVSQNLTLETANVNLRANLSELNMPVVRVPAYSPYAVAEHAAALMMTLNRKTHRAFNRTREQNFRLTGLLGFDMNGKTVGIIGTGKIGAIYARICKGFGCRVLAYDVAENPAALSYGVEYVPLEEIWKNADIISLHCPLFPSTKHVINENSIKQMKDGVMIINTSRGALINTEDLVEGIKSNKISSVGLDVFEGEQGYFYSDRSGEIIANDMLARLFTFPNVIITGHQAFFTEEALDNIARTTIDNIAAYIADEPLVNEINVREPQLSPSMEKISIFSSALYGTCPSPLRIRITEKRAAAGVASVSQDLATLTQNHTTTTVNTMQIAFFSSHSYDIESMERVAKRWHSLPTSSNSSPRVWTPHPPSWPRVAKVSASSSTMSLMRLLCASWLRNKVMFLRCAGFDMIDLKVAKELGLAVIRVPAYSPFAVAEHAAALMLTLNRKIHRSYNRTREQNFRLAGLLGFDINGKTIGVVGTGKIGALFARIAAGFGAKVLAYDHTINADSIAKMKKGVVIINTSRGGLIDNKALVDGLKSGKIGAVGLDVFEGEGEYFYSDRSGAVIQDETLARLFTFPNVLITGHQAFFTKEALDNIALTTFANVKAYVANETLVNEVHVSKRAVKTFAWLSQKYAITIFFISQSQLGAFILTFAKNPASRVTVLSTLLVTTMKIAFFSTHSYDIESMERIAKEDGVTPAHEITFLVPRLDHTSARLAEGCEGVCIFVNDIADEESLRALHAGGTRAVSCAALVRHDRPEGRQGARHNRNRVPAYSPYAVAEHAAALMMTLNRKIHRSYNRTREQNFRLAGLLGFDVNGKTIGVVGTGKIGACSLALLQA